ncbi:MAG TPA: DUF6526 family protein [Candidatus Angelobacter sp.]
MDEKAQTFANHSKYDPPFHFFLLPVMAINIIVVGYYLVRSMVQGREWLGGAWLLILSFALLVTVGRLRAYATQLQDRIIRVEERLRLGAVLPEALRSRIGELSDSQLVGLRFASDAELPALVQRALDEKLDRTQIKKAVTDWRPDYSRV